MDVRRNNVRLVGFGGGSHRFKSVEESNEFVRRFSKALVEALVRGDGSMAVYMDGQVVEYGKEEAIEQAE